MSQDEDEDNGESSDYTDDEDPDDDELLTTTEAERKTNTTAEPQTAPATDQAVQNDLSSPLPISLAATTSLAGAMSPRTSSPSQCKPVDMNPQPPPWSARDEDVKPSVSRTTSPHLPLVHGLTLVPL